ncbi:hypothetical protein Tco_1323105 [Tanacetum coccineum]
MKPTIKGFSSSNPSGSAAIPIVTSLEATVTVRGEFYKASCSLAKTSFLHRGEPQPIVTKLAVLEVAEVKKEPQDTEPIPITIVRPITKTVLEAAIIESSSKHELTDPILEVPTPQQPKKPSHTTPKHNKGNGIARDIGDSPLKLVKSSKEVCQDPDAPMLIGYEINRVMYQLINEQIQAHLEKEEQMQKAAQEEKLITLSKPELIKVVKEVTSEARVDPKALRNSKDKLSVIISKNKNKVVGELIESLSKKYERLKEFPVKLGINPSLPLPEQVLSLSSRRKRKALELESEVRIAGLECNYSHPKVEVESLLGYMVMAGNVNTREYQRFCMLIRKMIDEHPNREKLKSKKEKDSTISVRRHSVNEVPKPKKKVMGSVSYGNKVTRPHTISSTLEYPKDKSLKNRQDKFKWIRSSTYPSKVKLS